MSEYRVGTVVKVVSGRKVAKGTVGVMIWRGENRFDRYNDRIGMKDATGEVHWTYLYNVEEATEEEAAPFRAAREENRVSATERVKASGVIKRISVFLDSNGDSDASDYWKFWRMINKDSGRWKSDKERDFWLNRIDRYGSDDLDGGRGYYGFHDEAKFDVPEGTLAIVVSERMIGRREWGRKMRRKIEVIYLGETGVIRVDTAKIKYEDSRGASGVSGIIKGEPMVTVHGYPAEYAGSGPAIDDPEGWERGDYEEVAA